MSEIISQINFKMYNFPVVYKNILQDELTTRHFDIIDRCFFSKTWEKEIHVSYQLKTHFVTHHSDCTHNLTQVLIRELCFNQHILHMSLLVWCSPVLAHSVTIQICTGFECRSLVPKRLTCTLCVFSIYTVRGFHLIYNLCTVRNFDHI